MAKKNKTPDNQIAKNKRAYFDYFVEEKFEAGIVLAGWEVKSIRTGKMQLNESHVVINREGELVLLNANIQAYANASTHHAVDPFRSRKLLLHKKEISKLIGLVQRKGYTLIALNSYWKGPKVKVTLGLALGKKQYDKRASTKDRDWKIDKERLLKGQNR